MTDDPPEYLHMEDPDPAAQALLANDGEPAALPAQIANPQKPIWNRGSHILIGESEEGVRVFIASGTEQEMEDRSSDYQAFFRLIIAEVVEVIG